MKKYMTNQEIFDKVATHLLKQKRRALRSIKEFGFSDACAYKTSKGLKCAVGCLIPKDKYNPKFEGWGVGDDKIINALNSWGISKNSAELLEDLQSIHDCYEPKRWKELLIKLGKKRRFKINF